MKAKPFKILAVTGIRSEYDILYPVLDELRTANHQVFVAVSGAHLSDDHGNTYRRIEEDGFTIADKIDSLLPTSRLVQRCKGTGMLIQGLSQTAERINPDFLLMIGDREESIATAIVGNYMNILTVHVGGGDTVVGNADDPMRFAVSKLAHIHCCFAEQYARNLRNIGEEDFRIFNTGNPAYVNIAKVPDIPFGELKETTGLRGERYVVLIKHPLSSEVEQSYQQMKTTLEALEQFCLKHDFEVVAIPPNSDPGSFEMLQAMEEFREKPWFHFNETLPRKYFINLMRRAAALIGNSSMGILEAPFYKLPVVNVGNRQKGRLNAGNVVFVPYETGKIVHALEQACLDADYRAKIEQLKNPFGDETAAVKIRQAIESVEIENPRWYVKMKLC